MSIPLLMWQICGAERETARAKLMEAASSLSENGLEYDVGVPVRQNPRRETTQICGSRRTI